MRNVFIPLHHIFKAFAEKQLNHISMEIEKLKNYPDTSDYSKRKEAKRQVDMKLLNLSKEGYSISLSVLY